MKQEFKRLLQWVRNCPVEASMKIDELKGEIEQQQKEIEKLTRIAIEADEGCEYWKERYKQAQAKAERCEKALRKIIDESICRGEDCTWGDTCCAVIARKALDGEDK